MIHSSLIAVHCSDSGYVGKQPVALKKYYVEYRFKELQEIMDRCTGCRDIPKRLLKTVTNTMQSIDQLNCHESRRRTDYQTEKLLTPKPQQGLTYNDLINGNVG